MGKTLFELKLSDCRWINDDGTFCAERVYKTTSYCKVHAQRVFQKPEKAGSVKGPHSLPTKPYGEVEVPEVLEPPPPIDAVEVMERDHVPRRHDPARQLP